MGRRSEEALRRVVARMKISQIFLNEVRIEELDNTPCVACGAGSFFAATADGCRKNDTNSAKNVFLSAGGEHMKRKFQV